jgi:hypothetical protein
LGRVATASAIGVKASWTVAMANIMMNMAMIFLLSNIPEEFIVEKGDEGR